MTTPKQITYKLVRFGRKNPGAEVTVFEIPQIPGYRARSHSAKGIDESFITTVYAIPIALFEPLPSGRSVCGLSGAWPIPFDPEGPDNSGTGEFVGIDGTWVDIGEVDSAKLDAREFVHCRYTGAACRGQWDGLLGQTGARAQRARPRKPIQTCRERALRMSQPQSFNSHARFDPPYHFFLTIVSIASIIIAGHLLRSPFLLLLGVASGGGAGSVGCAVSDAIVSAEGAGARDPA